jgi:hypothetical protein
MPLGETFSKSKRLALSLLLTVGGVTIASSGFSTRALARGAPICRDDQLSMALRGDGAAMGHLGYRLVFSRAGPGRCSLTGPLKATFEDTSGEPATVPAKETKSGYVGGLELNGSSSRPLPLVVLKPRTGKSSVLIEGDDVPLGTATPCSINYSLEIVLTFARIGVSSEYGMKYGFRVKFDDRSQPQVHPVVPSITGTEN